MTTPVMPVTTADTGQTGGARRRRRGGINGRWRPLWNVVGIIVGLVWIFPVYWMVLTAFRPLRDILATSPTLWPKSASLTNFKQVVDDHTFWAAMRTSLIVTLSAVVVATLVGFFAAVAIARFKFYGRRPFVVVVMLVQMVPLVAITIPILLNLKTFGLSGSLLGLVLAYLAVALPFTVWMLRGFVAGVPKDLEEAAMVDGCTRFGAFVRIILPLVLPGLAATSVFSFVTAWNEFQLTNFLVQSASNNTLQLWLVGLTGQRQNIPYGEVMAGSTLIALPVVIFFMIVQRNIASGITAGAVKG